MMVITTWLVHCVLIAAVLAVGAHAWEASARWSGRSARWAWLGALCGSVGLPWLLQLVPERVAGDVSLAAIPVMGSMPVAAEPFPLVDEALPALPADLTPVAVTLWVVLSLGVVGYIGWMTVSVARAQRRWRRAELEGGEVWVARNVGPAALGIRAGMVVLPAWALQLAAELRALLLLHEREHVRAGDPRMVFAALLLLAAMPWNPVVWYMVLRLRNAIELDCDARVLRQGVDPRTYGALLLEVGRRRGGSPLVMATFAEPRLFLEERIRRIARWPLERRRGRAVGLAGAAVVLFAGGVTAGDALRPVELVVTEMELDSFDPPTELELVWVDTPIAGDDNALRPMASDTPPGGLMAGPTFTPMTVRPELRNSSAVMEALRASYPPMLRDAGIGGTAIVWFFIDESGSVRRAMISKSSGFPALDEAALTVASQMQFAPARNRDAAVAVWVEIPIVFTPDGVRQQEQPVLRGRDDQAAQERRRAVQAELDAAQRRSAAGAARPEVEVLPRLQNAEEARQLLLRNYPPLLRDAGVGGTAVVWFYVDDHGRVVRTLVAQSSGHKALDDAAIGIANQLRFSPHVVDGRREQTWVALPVSFGGAAVPALERVHDPIGGRGMIPVAPLYVHHVAGVPPTPPPPPQQTASQQDTGRVAHLMQLLDAGRLDEFVTAARRAREARELTAEQLDQIVQQVAVRGFRATQAGRHDEALQFYAAARRLGSVSARTEGMINFFHGYTLLRQGEPLLRQGGDAESVRRAQVLFEQAKRMLEGSASYTEQAATRAQLVRQAEQYMEVGQALQRRGIPAPDARTEARTEAPEQLRSELMRVPPPPPPPARAIEEAPTFTPMTKRPEMRNAGEVQRALVRTYPPALRDAGIGGTPVVWFFIDETGAVRRTQLSRSSGYPALDEAALAVAYSMQFAPAENRGREVAVWVEIPISFTAR